jgi:ATP-dependent RNA helicase RhlE
MIPSMKEFDLIPALAEAVADMGYTCPTPIQAQGIPVVLAGRDLIGCASTGTGKTAAFLLPILQRLQGRRDVGCRALILSPTRELALQIDEQVLALGYHVGLSAVAVVGGVDMRPQERALRDGCEIVVATPGRLLDHMRFKYVDLSAVEVVVIDEADRMLDMGFLPDVRRILAALPATRQTLLFSATLPASIREFARTILRDPITVTVDRRQPADGIVHRTYRVAQHRKSPLLTTLLRPSEMRSVLVFVKRKVDADRVARAVVRSGVNATSLHSNRSQAERTAALDAFRRGACPVLVATDVAGRGLDISGISHVINFDVPRCPDDYIHRAGRTARAGATGDVITFIAPDEEDLLDGIQVKLGIALPLAALPDSISRVSTAERQPVADRRRRRYDRRRVAHGPSGRRSERAAPATPLTMPTSASAPTSLPPSARRVTTKP